MKQTCLLLTSMFLLLQISAAQEHFLMSGSINQPHICMQKNAVTDSVKPLLYLLIGGRIAELPVAGNYTRSGNSLCYDPLYPLAAGQQFLLRADGFKDTIIEVQQEEFMDKSPLSAVSNIYPLTDSIPENILFFHVRFTQAMQQNKQAWKYVHVLDENGKVIPDTWRQRSFWLDSGRLLVLMIHPGRVKSGIRYTGRVFENHKKYTLSVDSSLLDFYGRNIVGTQSHTYYTLPEQTTLLKPCTVLQKIEAGTKNPVVIKFCNGVDYAAALTSIFLYNNKGSLLACKVQQSEHRTIQLLPNAPWPKGRIKLELSGGLYDCAGNRLNRLFEMKNTKTFNKDNKVVSFTILSE